MKDLKRLADPFFLKKSGKSGKSEKSDCSFMSGNIKDFPSLFLQQLRTVSNFQVKE